MYSAPDDSSYRLSRRPEAVPGRCPASVSRTFCRPESVHGHLHIISSNTLGIFLVWAVLTVGLTVNDLPSSEGVPGHLNIVPKITLGIFFNFSIVQFFSTLLFVSVFELLRFFYFFQLHVFSTF